MSAAAQGYMNVGRDVIGGLIETVSLALLTEFPNIKADALDVELVLDALNVLRPNMYEIDTFRGIQHMANGHWDESIRVFTEVTAAAPQFTYAKALLAFCLSAKGDAGWQPLAAEALEGNPTKETRMLVRALTARDDLRVAVRSRQSGKPFVMPMSCVELSEDAEEAKTSASAPAGESGGASAGRTQDVADPNQQFMYLRV
jgi:type III secretion protein HrpB1